MFLLVPAHPGFPGQIPQSRKTVVCCVCVTVFVMLKLSIPNIHLVHTYMGLAYW